MSSRNLELNLRARADTSGITKLVDAISRLEKVMSDLGTAMQRANDISRGFATTGERLATQEDQTATSSQRLATAVERTAAAREHAVVMTKNAIVAEERAILASERQEQASLRTAVAQEKLIQSQAATEVSASKAAVAEEKLAQERLKTEAAAKRVEKEEANIAKAREQARAAAAKAEEAEARLSKSRQSMGQIGNVLKGALGAAGIVMSAQAIGQQLIQLGRDSLEAASRAEEGATKFKAVFKDMSGEVMRELEVMASANRRSSYDLVDYSSQLQAVFTSMGVSAEQAREMSTSVTQLGVDFGAFFNIADSHAVDNLTSALIGNHRAVKQFGIPLNIAAINMELLRMGMSGLQGEALEAAKVMARFNIIMRASSNIQGAAIREAQTYANVMKAWQASVMDLKVAIGQGLEPAMSRLAEVGTNFINALLGKDGQEALGRWSDEIEKASDVDDYVLALQTVKYEIINLGSAWEVYWAKRGNIGSADAVRPIIEDMALAASSAEEFTAAIEKLDLNQRKYFQMQDESGRMFTASPELFYQLIKRQEELAQKTRDVASNAADADRALRVLAGMPDIEVEVNSDVEEEARRIEFQVKNLPGKLRNADLKIKAKAILGIEDGNALRELRKLQGNFEKNELLINAKLSFKGGRGDAELRERASELREAWLDAFSSDPINELVEAQQNLFSGDAGGAQEAREQVEAANAAIVKSFKERAFEILSAKALESGNSALINSINQVAVAMGLMTQEEANMRTSYANTLVEIEKLTNGINFMGLTASAQGSAIAGLAAGVYDTADAARTAAENLDAVRQFWANGPQGDIGSFYQGLSDPGRMAEIETNIKIAIDENNRAMYEAFKTDVNEFSATEYKAVIATEFGTSVSDFTTLKSVAEEYDTATYTSDIRADLGNTKSDIDSLRTQLQGLTAAPWVVRIQQVTTTSSTTDDPNGDDRRVVNKGSGTGGRTSSTPTYVVEGVTVNNYSGGPGVADQTRRGVLAAFRSLS